MINRAEYRVKSLSKGGDAGYRTDFTGNLVFFILLLIPTIVFTYYIKGPVSNLWYIATLFIYAVSKNEPLWLAFYLTTVDGFMGLMGLYSLTLTIIPGLPGIEVSQFYIMIALVKAIRKNVSVNIFYNKYLQILMLYVIFMIIWGQITGFSGGLNAYFRVLKMVLPLSLFYSVPRLLTTMKSYEDFFGLVFLVFLTGFVSQLFSLITGYVPFSSAIGENELFSEPGTFRGFYNAVSTLISLFAALAYLSFTRQKAFNRVVLYLVISSAFGMAFISATRGWILGLGLIIILQLFFMINMGKREVPWLGAFLILLFAIGLSNPKIKQQIDFSKERLLTLESLAEGDTSADNTLQRIDERSPVVMNIWQQRPLFGWGFSDMSWEHGDGHVGNQNLLMVSGIVGYGLLTGFLLYFSLKMTQWYFRSRRFGRGNEVIIMFPVFLLGWFVIHSTSGQQFAFSGLPLNIIPLAVFFSFGAMVYAQSKAFYYGKKL